MTRLMAQLERVAASETRVCILGETGTGKELVARTLHQKSQRSSGPFITLNCAAVPAELIESELFGHEKGSFTGAAARHLGKFEQANGGTLFLDEIGDMPLSMQAKLLRVLEEGEVERIGGNSTVKVDVRVIVATHRDLSEQVREGKFRQDLFHRVYVFPITLPPLRERRDDIPVLIDHFQKQIARQNNWKPAEFTSDAIAELQLYGWPGNVRELRNMIERLLLLTANNRVDSNTVKLALPMGGQSALASPNSDGQGPLSQRMDEVERRIILSELERQQNHITNTAKALGLERSHLYKKCQHLGIDLASVRKGQG
jgi:DNA-binding NtrC family response regulator